MILKFLLNTRTNIKDSNTKKNSIILVFLDGMAAMFCNEKLNSIVTELFIRVES